jgi:peptidoglycan/xylan/chitin deacetylase (PgdA/CDA1 family)
MASWEAYCRRFLVAALAAVLPILSKPTLCAEALCHGSRSVHAVALTFDACETEHPAGYDATVIRILRSTRTPATLFLGGRWMETHPSVTKQLSRDPLFELANHSYLHRHMHQLTDAQVQEEISKTQEVMFELTGRRARLFRAPFGEYDSRVLRVAEHFGLTAIQWDVVSGDPDRHVTAWRMLRGVARRTHNGSIIIMHLNGRGWHTAEALPMIIARLKRAGYRFATVGALLGKAHT